MGDMQVISETPINMHQLKKELEKIRKRDNELNFRAARTEEYLIQVSVNKHADELFEKIMKLNIPRLKEQHVDKIIDILPKDIDSLRAIFSNESLSLKEEDFAKILDVVKKYV